MKQRNRRLNTNGTFESGREEGAGEGEEEEEAAGEAEGPPGEVYGGGTDR